MKKIMMTLAAAFVAVSMSAQVYVGGSVSVDGWSSQENAGDRSETTFKFMPEIGYNLNEDWAIGTVIGYENNKWDGVEGVSESAFVVAPYARYTYLKSGKLSLFVDGGVSFESASEADWTAFGVGLKPGLAVNLTDNVSFVSHIGFIGYETLNPSGAKNSINHCGVDLSGENLSFGLYFNF